MSIQSEITRLETAKSAIAAAIAGKGVTVPDGTMLDGMAALIAGIEAGGGGGGSGGASSPVCLKDVNFYDYDGTLIASYTIAEAQALTALPDGPTHTGLTFQGWNWSLGDIHALTRPMNVGAMYITDDGKTRLNIRISDRARATIPFYFSQTVASGVSIDWGDGSEPETLSGTGNVSTTHTYAAAGDYTISLTVANGCTLGLGHASNSYCVMGSNGNNGRVYCNLLQSVHIGEGVKSIENYAFRYCQSLASITIPKGLTSIGVYAFSDCYSLSSITIPDGVTSIGNYAFNNCYSLEIIMIPDGVTSIGGYAFSDCYSLSSIMIPDGVTSIGGYAFINCYSLKGITIPDGVTSILNYAFRNCHSLSSITIPDGVTSIGNYAFNNCYSLASITIPGRVTSIGGSAFANCWGMAEYHMEPTTPPALSNTQAFSNIPSDCIIYVPVGCLEAYKTATNWSTYASYMREEAA